eukprot:gene43388-53875_t
MLLTQDQEMIRDAVRDFAQTELWPHAARWDKEHHFPKEAHQGLAALGAYGICVPEEFGGAHLDYVTLALVLEEIAAGDGGTSTAISVTNCPVNAILMRYGNAQQKRDWPLGATVGGVEGAAQRHLEPGHRYRRAGLVMRRLILPLLMVGLVAACSKQEPPAPPAAMPEVNDANCHPDAGHLAQHNGATAAGHHQALE